MGYCLLSLSEPPLSLSLSLSIRTWLLQKFPFLFIRIVAPNYLAIFLYELFVLLLSIG